MRFGIRELVFLVVLLSVPAASFFYVFKPRNDMMEAARSEIEVKKTRLERLAEVSTKIEDIDLAIEQGRESIALIEKKLPSEQDVEGILGDVWQIASDNRLAVKSIKSEKPVPASKYRELPLKMTVEGQFTGFYQFLLELENLPRITRMHKLSIERAGSKGSRNSELPPNTMTADFVLSIYFEPSDNTPSE